MKLTPTELHNTAPLGSFVTVSDGTKQPPAAHKNKLIKWKSRNNNGILTEINKGNSGGWADKPMFTLTQDYGGIVVNRIIGLNDDGRRYEFQPPKPGSILACSEYNNELEVKHVWRDEDAMRLWECNSGYDINDQNWKLFVITETGERETLNY